MKNNPFTKILQTQNTYLRCDGDEVFLCSTDDTLYLIFPTLEESQKITEEVLRSVEIIGKNTIKFWAPKIDPGVKIELKVFIVTPAEIF